MMKFEGFSGFASNLDAAKFGMLGSVNPRVVGTVLAFGYLVYVLYFFVIAGVVDTQKDSLPAPPQTINSRTLNQSPPPDLLQISQWHLFGQNLNSSEVANGSISETQLQLKLLGVFMLSTAPENASAIIQTGDAQQKKYRPGDELPGGAKLQSIEQARVVLKHGEREESLLMKKNSTGSTTPTE